MCTTRKSLAATLLLLLNAGVLAEPAVSSEVSPEVFPEVFDETVDRLDALGRIWGQARYFHPGIFEGQIDWDEAGIEAIRATLNAPDRAAFRSSVASMLSRLGDSNSRVVPAGGAGEDAGADHRFVAQEKPVVERLDENTALVRINDWTGLSTRVNPLAANVFDEVLPQIVDLPHLIFDFRRFDQPVPGPLDLGAFVISRAIQNLVSELSPADLILPSVAQVIHSGYPSERWRTDNYYTATIRRNHQRLAAAESVPGERFIVFVHDEHGGAITPFANALAQAGAGASIVEGNAGSAGPSSTVPLLDEGYSAIISTSMLVNADGSRGAIVAKQVETPGAEAKDDAALAEAMLVVTERYSGSQGEGSDTPLVQIFESSSQTGAKLSVEERVLAAFKLWNAIEFFFPYHDLTDQDWDSTLKAAIPAFINADTDIEYAKAVAALAARANDTHITIGSMAYERFMGTHTPNVQTILVGDDTLIVKEVIDPALAESGVVRTGDVITHVDSEPVASKIERLRPFVPASNEGSYKLRLESRLLAGLENSDVEVTLKRAKERRPISVTLKRDTYYYFTSMTPEGVGRRDHPKMEMLDGDISYFNIGRLGAADEAATLDLLFQSRGAVIDMRGYPNGGHLSLAMALADSTQPSARIVEPFIFQAADFSPAWKTNIQEIQPGPRHYPHPVVLLVNHVGISAAEHYSMMVKAAGQDRVTIVGSPTNGANGVITEVPLPGETRVTFTGMQAAWADGSQLQRKGVIPDVHAEPTVASVRAGRDEVLDVALRVLKKKIGKRD